MVFEISKSDNFEVPEPDHGRIEDYWNFIGGIPGVDGSLKFKNLSILAITCACISKHMRNGQLKHQIGFWLMGNEFWKKV